LRALIAQGGIVGWTCRSEPLLEVLESIANGYLREPALV
jgi:hypothetical protein